MPSLNYFPNNPSATNSPAVDQPLMQTNFSSLKTFLDVDHTDFGDINAGTHQQITLPYVQTDPFPLPSGTAAELYTKNMAGLAQLFFANNAGTNQITGLAKNFVGTGSVTLPGGLQLRWGHPTATTSFTTFSFSAAFTNACFAVVATCDGGTSTIGVQSITATNFQAKSSSGSVLFYYIAIGW